MSIPSDFSDLHDNTDTCLGHVAGLAEALDDLLDAVPELCTASRTASMVRAVLASLHR